MVRNQRPQEAELDHSRIGLQTSEQISDSHLRVTVVFTTYEGTLAALRTAKGLARSLGVRVALVNLQVVPFHFALNRPPVAIDFLEQRSLSVLAESGIGAEEASIELYLCRDRRECLQRILPARALIVVGGKKSWLAAPERKLEKMLRRLGHQVIFVDVNSRSEWKTRIRSFMRSFLPLAKPRKKQAGNEISSTSNKPATIGFTVVD